MYINDIRLLRSHFELQYEHLEEEIEDIEVSLKLGHKLDEESMELTVLLTMFSEQEGMPFHFDIEFGGKFIIDASEKDHIDRLSKVNCPAIIFPYIREHLAELSRKSGLKPYHINPINFVQLTTSINEE